MEVDLSKYNNSYYKPGSVFKRVIWYFTNSLLFKSSWFPFIKPKVFLLRAFGAKVGKNLVIKNNVNIKYPWKLEIGNHCWIGEEVWIDNLHSVIIMDNVCLS